MSIRRSSSRGSFVGSQMLERRRMLSAAIQGRELDGLIGAMRETGESIVVDRNVSSSSESRMDSRTNQSKTSTVNFDPSRVITPRDGSIGSNQTTSKGPESIPITITGTENADTIVMSVSGANILIEINGAPTFFDDALFDSFVIDGLGGADTINVESNGANPTTLRGGAGADTITLTSTGGDLDRITAAVVVDGGADGASLGLYDDVNLFSDPYTITNNQITRDFFGGVSFGSITSLDLSGQSADSTFNVQSTLAGSVTVSGNGGNDVCRITESSGNLEDLGGTFIFDGGTDEDQIWLYDTNNEFHDAFTMNANAIVRPFVDPVTCTAEDIRVLMGSGDNQFTINDFDQSYMGLIGSGGNDTLIVNGLAADTHVDFNGNVGANQVAVERTSLGSELFFLGEGDGDSMSLAYGSGDLNDIAGLVSYLGMAGSNDSITLWDDLSDAARNYQFELGTFTRSGGFGQLGFNSISNVTLQGTQGSNQINVNATASGTNLVLSSNNGDDSVVFTESPGSLVPLASTVNFVGGAGSDGLHFFDYLRPTSSDYTFTSTQLSGAGFATQTFSGVEAAYLYAGDGVNEITVSNTNAIEQFVYGGDGVDIIHVPNTVTPVRISGGDGLDEFFIGTPPNLNFAGVTAQAVASGESVDQLAQLRVELGSTLSIADQHTLACAFESVAGTLSFGQRSNYIAVAGAEPLFLSSALIYINAGYNAGAWNGMNGSFSSHYSASTTVGDGIGYARASDIGVNSYNNFSVFPDDLIFTQTRYGDANLDHTVNFNDLLKLAQNYNTTNKFWFHGDFDYNQSVNFADLLRTAQNYGQSAMFSERRIGSVGDSVLRDS